jgi:hypothetical protein
VYPDTDPKMSLSRVKQTFNFILYIFPYVSKPGMVEPMLGGIFGKRKSPETVSGDDVLIQK